MPLNPKTQVWHGRPAPSSLDFKDTLTRAELQAWLREAKQVNPKDPEVQRRILELEQRLGRLQVSHLEPLPTPEADH